MKTIQDLEEINKPREKLYKRGAQSLKDYELLAILLGSGVKGKDVITLSKEIIKILEEDFTSITLEKLTNIHGLGRAKASQILASIELCKRYIGEKQNLRISSSRDVYGELIPYKDKQQEYFLALIFRWSKSSYKYRSYKYRNFKPKLSSSTRSILLCNREKMCQYNPSS